MQGARTRLLTATLTRDAPGSGESGSFVGSGSARPFVPTSTTTDTSMLSSRSAPLLHNDLDYGSLLRPTATKTPGRALKGRAGLQENAVQHGSLTANPREKKVTIQSPFRQKSAGSSE